MHVSLFGAIKILEEMKALSSSFEEGNLQQMVVCGTTLWHVGASYGVALFRAREAKQSPTRSRARSSL
jgi:hypothetical protein